MPPKQSAQALIRDLPPVVDMRPPDRGGPVPGGPGPPGSPSSGSVPQVRRREAWVELPEPYAGFKFRLWLSAPSATWLAVEGAGAYEALSQLVLEHNGWRDEDGVVYPPPSEPAFWTAIPTELAGCVVAASQAEMAKLPNSLMPTRRR
jgi:hypothetical protein